MKELNELKGVKILSKNQQKSIKGGWWKPCWVDANDGSQHCLVGFVCVNDVCIPG